ncbi:hypothetical protein EAE96_011470 [Botrytis aclada]|nr:hypothetical protein EAE96_011470 [Botrytis aclada]
MFRLPIPRRTIWIHPPTNLRLYRRNHKSALDQHFPPHLRLQPLSLLPRPRKFLLPSHHLLLVIPVSRFRDSPVPAQILVHVFVFRNIQVQSYGVAGENLDSAFEDSGIFTDEGGEVVFDGGLEGDGFFGGSVGEFGVVEPGLAGAAVGGIGAAVAAEPVEGSVEGGAD